MHATIDGNELVIRIPLQDPAPSRSGKTLVVASSRGNVQTQAKIDGRPITVGLNAYVDAGGLKPRQLQPGENLESVDATEFPTIKAAGAIGVDQLALA